MYWSRLFIFLQKDRLSSDEIEAKYRLNNETIIKNPAEDIEMKYYKKLEYRCQSNNFISRKVV